jgi:hypothetical protein
MTKTKPAPRERRRVVKNETIGTTRITQPREKVHAAVDVNVEQPTHAIRLVADRGQGLIPPRRRP